MSALVFQFLRDFRGELGRNALEAWLAGNEALIGQSGVRGQMIALADIDRMTVDGMKHFYGVATEAELVEREKAAKRP